MKVLVISLSGQPIPNLLSVEAVKPDIVAYVETDEMKKGNVWHDLKAALDLYDMEFDDRKFTLENETSFDSIVKLFRDIREEYAGDELIVNLTGGTKPMSIGAYDVFRKSHAKFLYMHSSQINKFEILGEDQTLDFRSSLSVRQFLKAYGFDSTSDEKIEERAKRNSEYFDLAVHLTANYDTDTISECLSNLTRIYVNRGKKHPLVIRKSDNLSTEDRLLKSFLMENLGMDSRSDKSFHGTLNKRPSELLRGEWLEIFFWGLLDKWSSSLDIFDLAQSVNIQKKIGDGILENEWDATFLHDNTLFVIECKTGVQGYDEKGTSTLYKFNSVTSQLKALKTRIFLTTTAGNIFDGSGNIRKAFATRAKEYGCKIITGDEIKQLANAHLKNENENVKNILKEMFNLQPESSNRS